MASLGEHDDKVARIERIREIVKEDFERVTSSQDPYEILNVAIGETLQQIEERYQRYERFYRAENFQRLGDIDLTRKALDIRRSLGRAIVEVRKRGAKLTPSPRHIPSGAHSSEMMFNDMGAVAPPMIEHDHLALSQIYLRDGMSYLQIGDLGESSVLLRRALQYNPSSGVTLAYLGYVVHKHRSFDPQAIKEAQECLDRATQLAPDDPDVYILRGRFFAKQHDVRNLQDCIDQIERINPAHPMLDRLQKKLRNLIA